MDDGRASASTRSDEPAALGLPREQGQSTKDDEEEWEYEYSTSETETYYLTLELSYPEFKGHSKAQNVYNARGGHYYKKWLGPATEQGDAASRPSETKKQGSGGKMTQIDESGDDDEDEEPVPAAEVDDDHLEIDPSLMDQTYEMDAARREQEKQEKQRLKAQRDQRARDEQLAMDNDAHEPDLSPVEDIQILDLHSDRPYISYRGRVFEGQWAEVIGTEMILASHEKKSQDLPALRQLDGNIDLLAASCSRILTTEKVLKARQAEEDPLAEVNKEWLIRIPFGLDHAGERAQQAHFLEKLIGLKLKKGETDNVTVYAKEAEGKNFSDNRDPGFRPRKRKFLDHDGEVDDDGFRKRSRPPWNTEQPLGRPRKHPLEQDRSHPPSGSIPVQTTPNLWGDLGVDDEESGDDDDDDGSLEINDKGEADHDTNTIDSQGSEASQQSDGGDDDEEGELYGSDDEDDDDNSDDDDVEDDDLDDDDSNNDEDMGGHGTFMA